MGVWSKITNGVKEYHNRNELTKAIIDDLLDPIMDAVMERLKEALIDFVYTDVYSAFSPKWYDRTYSLADENLWSYQKPYISGDKVMSAIGQIDGSTFTFAEQGLPIDYDAWQHGNKYYGDLSPQEFVSIINEGSTGGIANFPSVQPRPFWEHFEAWVQNNVGEIFKQECNKHGLKIY